MCVRMCICVYVVCMYTVCIMYVCAWCLVCVFAVGVLCGVLYICMWCVYGVGYLWCVWGGRVCVLYVLCGVCMCMLICVV